MSSIGDRVIQFLTVFVIITVATARPQQIQRQTDYLPPSIQSDLKILQNSRQTFYVPPSGGQRQAASSNQQQQFLSQPPVEAPIQLQIPIPYDGVEEKKIYVQLPPQQYPQQPQYRYPPRKHYKIILVRSPPRPTPPPAPVLPEIEEQTLVYVLVKKNDSPSPAELEELQQQQQQQSIKLNKPEVYFIKYKANEQRDNGSVPTVASEAIEKSIEQQLSNNLDAGYSYSSLSDGTSKRVAKNLNQEEQQAGETEEKQK